MAKKTDVTERVHPLARPGYVVQCWRTRGGVRVPGPECLPPSERISVRRFAALMDEMMGVDEASA